MTDETTTGRVCSPCDALLVKGAEPTPCPEHGWVALGGPPVKADENGCYGWPRACDHNDDLGCVEAEEVTTPASTPSGDQP